MQGGYCEARWTDATISYRVAQMVVKQYLEPILEPHFHLDSYGYRPGNSALDAVGSARKRCWKYHGALDVDIKSFFDTCGAQAHGL